jgi:type II secretory pathway pseudopilin PulG
LGIPKKNETVFRLLKDPAGFGMINNSCKGMVRRRGGFTRIELSIVVATVSLIGAMALTVLGENRQRSERIVCANNLRQVGRAFHMWASDHGGENPWWVSYRDGGSLIRFNDPVPPGLMVPGGGFVPAAVRNNAWLHFAFVGPELQTAETLVCPTDRARRRALDFSTSSSHGYLSLNFRNNATSYFVGLHALSQFPLSILSGDRSIQEDSINANCSANIGTAAYIDQRAPRRWLEGMHDAGGNILFNDGAVEELSPIGLTRIFNGRGIDDGNASEHILKPN